MTEWFDKAKSLLGINSELNHLFLINALSIDYLCEVPLECNVLMVDIFGKCNFWVNVLKFHKMTSISKGKVNFIMNFLNTRKEVREIIVFLNDHTKFSTIRNEVESVFEKFQGDDGLSSLKKASFETSKRLKNQILDSLDYMENHYFTTMDVDGHHGADREMLIEAHYKKIMDQTLADIYRKINEVSNEDFSKLHPNDLEMRYNVDEDKLTPEEKGIIGEKLNFLLKSYEKNFNKKIRRDNLKNVEIDLKNSAIDKEKINFILENKEKYC